MTLDRWLAVFGLLLALPGFLLLFFSAQQTIAIVVFLLAVVILAAAFIVHRLSNLAPFTMLAAEVTLDFLNDRGKAACLTKDYRIRANYPHLPMMTHKNIAADGQIRDIRWNDQPIPPADIKQMLGEYVVTVRFPYPPTRWREFPGKLSYEVLDSFEGNPEGLVYVVDFPTKTVIIRVNFPSGRPCQGVKAFKTEGAGQKPIGDPEISHDRKHLSLTLQHPRVGSEFVVHWNW